MYTLQLSRLASRASLTANPYLSLRLIMRILFTGRKRQLSVSCETPVNRLEG